MSTPDASTRPILHPYLTPGDLRAAVEAMRPQPTGITLFGMPVLVDRTMPPDTWRLAVDPVSPEPAVVAWLAPEGGPQ